MNNMSEKDCLSCSNSFSEPCEGWADLKDCEEKNMTREEALKIIRKIRAEEGKIPYDTDYSNGDHNFKWFLITNKEEWNAVCKCFELADQRHSVNSFPEWVCLEDDDCTIDFKTYQALGDSDGILVRTLSDSKAAFQTLLDSLSEEVINKVIIKLN